MKAASTRALVQLPGSAMRVKAGALRGELKRGGAVPDALPRYAQTLFTQVSRSAACVSAHAVEEALKTARGESILLLYNPFYE